MEKIFSVLFREPCYVTVGSQSDITFCQSLSELFIPAVGYPLSNEGAAFEIPVGVRNNLDLTCRGSLLARRRKNGVRVNFYMARRQIAIGFGDSLPESVSRFFFAEWIRDDPYAKLVAL